jgi:hypothetical protein
MINRAVADGRKSSPPRILTESIVQNLRLEHLIMFVSISLLLCQISSFNSLSFRIQRCPAICDPQYIHQPTNQPLPILHLYQYIYIFVPSLCKMPPKGILNGSLGIAVLFVQSDLHVVNTLEYFDIGWKGDNIVYERGEWQSLEFAVSIDGCHTG